LAEKGLDYVSRPVSLEEGEHIRPAYLAVNPNGVVPTLVHDGQTILDSSVIMEYLDDVFPSPRLSPPTASGRAHMRAWLRYIEEVPTVAVRFPSFNQVFLPHFAKQSAEQFEKDARDRPLRKHFYLRMGQKGFSKEDIEQSLERLAATVQRMDVTIAGEGPWLLGDTLSLADLCVAPLMDRMDDLGHSKLWESKPAFTDWLQRMRSRPSWRLAFFPGSRLSENFPEIKGVGATS